MVKLSEEPLRTTLSQVPKAYESIAKLIDQAVKEMFDRYDDGVHDIRGWVEVNVSQEKDFYHIGLWTRNRGQKDQYFNTTRSIHANGEHACTITATAAIIDAKDLENAGIAEEFNRKLRRAFEDSPVEILDGEFE